MLNKKSREFIGVTFQIRNFECLNIEFVVFSDNYMMSVIILMALIPLVSVIIMMISVIIITVTMRIITEKLFYSFVYFFKLETA